MTLSRIELIRCMVVTWNIFYITPELTQLHFLPLLSTPDAGNLWTRQTSLLHSAAGTSLFPLGSRAPRRWWRRCTEQRLRPGSDRCSPARKAPNPRPSWSAGMPGKTVLPGRGGFGLERLVLNGKPDEACVREGQSFLIRARKRIHTKDNGFQPTSHEINWSKSGVIKSKSKGRGREKKVRAYSD